MVTTNNGKTAFVSNTGSPFLSVIDPLSGRVPAEVEVEEDAEVPALLRTG